MTVRGATGDPRFNGADEPTGPAGADPALPHRRADEVLDDQPVGASQAPGRRPGERAAAQRRHHTQDGVRLGRREPGQTSEQEAQLVQPPLQRGLAAGDVVPDPPHFDPVAQLAAQEHPAVVGIDSPLRVARYACDHGHLMAALD